jgi:phosphoglycolate phosphatase-like HAD superfamily hydrolase
MDAMAPSARLIIFDVDGTLTDTTGVDDECYRAAVAEALGVDAAVVDWAGALHVTDAGILRYLWSTYGSGTPSDADYNRARSGFLKRITTAAETHGVRFGAVLGAGAALAAARHTGWRTAVATGGWGPSARLKLRMAGIDLDDETFACADDAESRAERLHATGAGVVLPNYFDLTTFLRALDTAPIPASQR